MRRREAGAEDALNAWPLVWLAASRTEQRQRWRQAMDAWFMHILKIATTAIAALANQIANKRQNSRWAPKCMVARWAYASISILTCGLDLLENIYYSSMLMGFGDNCQNNSLDRNRIGARGQMSFPIDLGLMPVSYWLHPASIRAAVAPLSCELTLL